MKNRRNVENVSEMVQNDQQTCFWARNNRNNFGNGLRVTTVDLPTEFVKKSVPQTKPGRSTQTTPFLSTTDGSNPFLTERVASIGGVA